MSVFDSIIGRAKEEAKIVCTFNFDDFEDYREITEDNLPAGEFFSDEYNQQRSVNYKSFFAPAFLLIAAIVVLIVWLTNPKNLILLVISFLLFVVGGYASYIIYKKTQDIKNAGFSCTHLGRGIILWKTTVNRHNPGTHPESNSPPIHFASVFFPDSKTYIRHVFCSDGGLRKTFAIGDTVVVYRHADSGEADLLPSTHVTVPPELMQRAQIEQVNYAESDKYKHSYDIQVSKKNAPKVYVIIFLVVLFMVLSPFLIALIALLLKASL